MAKKADFKGALGEIIEDKKISTNEVEVSHTPVDNQSEVPFILEKKVKKKNTKKSFPLYMDETKVNELDKICNKTGYTRNELINLMINYALDNIEIK